MSRYFLALHFFAHGQIHEVQDAQIYHNRLGQLNPFQQVTICNNMYLLPFILLDLRFQPIYLDIRNGQVAKTELGYMDQQ